MFILACRLPYHLNAGWTFVASYIWVGAYVPIRLSSCPPLPLSSTHSSRMRAIPFMRQQVRSFCIDLRNQNKFTRKSATLTSAPVDYGARLTAARSTILFTVARPALKLVIKGAFGFPSQLATSQKLAASFFFLAGKEKASLINLGDYILSN